jgi:hypothetical protein
MESSAPVEVEHDESEGESTVHQLVIRFSGMELERLRSWRSPMGQRSKSTSAPVSWGRGLRDLLSCWRRSSGGGSAPCPKILAGMLEMRERRHNHQLPLSQYHAWCRRHVWFLESRRR